MIVRMLVALGLAITLSSSASADKFFEQNFEEIEVGEAPSDFLILEGNFAVREEDGNRFLELPGTPLDSFGFLFGSNVKDGYQITAKVRSERTKRRYPTFGVGFGGVSGYKLRIDPNKKALEVLRREEESVVQVPFEWTSGEWTWVKFQIKKTADAAWAIQGKAWKEGDAEPAEWMISHEETKEPTSGKFSIWGKPFSEKAIQFDDLTVTKLE